MLSAREGLDDEHRRAAVSAHEGGPCAAMLSVVSGAVGGCSGRRLMQKLARGGDVSLAVGVGE